ncbi:MAG: conjugal transfer protein TraX [Erysipelotrichaceae bacterium]|nr:conjugal transfer protein TraX [Erysipelotrichaceae bacterium]
MIFMVLDHTWATLPYMPEWMTGVGRLTFPIFAFLTVEGFFHTSDIKKYMKRMLIFACISEIPFNLMVAGGIIFPFHQNVLFTFLIGLVGMYLMEEMKKKDNLLLTVGVAVLVVLMGYLMGTLTFVDYNGCGVLIIFVFYFFRGNTWFYRLGQLAGLFFVDMVLLRGLVYPVQLGNLYLEIPQQGLALLSLVFIWLYKGKQGYHSKPFQYFCYGFYPVHMMVLYLLAMLY